LADIAALAREAHAAGVESGKVLGRKEFAKYDAALTAELAAAQKRVMELEAVQDAYEERAQMDRSAINSLQAKVLEKSTVTEHSWRNEKIAREKAESRADALAQENAKLTAENREARAAGWDEAQRWLVQIYELDAARKMLMMLQERKADAKKAKALSPEPEKPAPECEACNGQGKRHYGGGTLGVCVECGGTGQNSPSSTPGKDDEGRKA